jgi:2',3'-cyclic-nucleotide 2'-phosphodiesterase / 3'-nucleotidase
MNKKIKIIYTSDIHGRISSYDFLTKTYGDFGLSRLSSFLKSINDPYLLIDNGDFLQGSPLIDFTRKNNLENPVALSFNALGYSSVNVGNHDFNFGLDYLNAFENTFYGNVICANVFLNDSPYFKPFIIYDLQGVKIALIGVTTEYIPFWERKENIKGLEFRDVVSVTKSLINQIKSSNHVDLVIVMYHGGYEKNITTDESYGQKTIENKGYQLFEIPEIDILLTGHQHVSQIHQKANRVTLQTGFNAIDFGMIEVKLSQSISGYQITHIQPELIKLNEFSVDLSHENRLETIKKQTNQYLDQVIGVMKTDMTISSPLDARIKKHPLFQLINEIQLDYTQADISLASLPNSTHGLPKEVTLNDIAVSFPFENDLVVIEINGNDLLAALEQNATYFQLDHEKIVVNPKFLHPKVEHYNYDVYDGISFEINVANPMGQKIKKVKINNDDLDLNQTYKVVMNSYRATGAGGFDMFKHAKVIASYPVSYFELISNYILNHPNLNIEINHNFTVSK